MTEIKQYVSNINGYYVKDAEARESINGKADAGTTLSDYGITDAYTKTEVDESLSTKASTDDTYTKTEIDTKFNLTNFNDYDYTDISASVSSGIRIRDNSYIKVVTNADGSLAKIYGQVQVYNDSADDSDNYMYIQTSLRPSTDITINCLGMRFGLSTLHDGNTQGGYLSSVTIKSNGQVRIPLAVPSDWTQTWVILSPCLLFIKDFGDTPDVI